MTALNAAKILALLSVVFLCGTAGIVVWRVGDAIDANLAGSAQAISGINKALRR